VVEFRVHLVRTLEAAASRAAADHDGLEQTPHKHRAVARRHYGNMVAVGFVNRRSNPTVRDLIENPEVVLLFHAGRGRHPDRVLRIRGRATFRTERSVCVLTALRYYLAPGGIWNMVRNRDKRAVDARYKGERAGGGGVIEVVPETAEFLRLPF